MDRGTVLDLEGFAFGHDRDAEQRAFGARLFLELHVGLVKLGDALACLFGAQVLV